MSTVLGTCGCTDVPKTTTPGTALDASETVEKKGNQAIYQSIAVSRFATFAEKYAWIKGRAACTGSTLCLNIAS